MRYLVTGGAGFIGSNVVEKLLAAGHSVRILDNFYTGKKERVPATAELIEGTITDHATCDRACAGMDGIFHLAAIPRMPYSIEHPQETNEVNVAGTINILLAARDAKVKRVVYSASSSAYGAQTKLPFVETMTPHPLSPYGLQKFVGEEYCRLFSELFGLETVSLRYFNVYGGKFQVADGAYPLVIALFIKQRLAGAPLTMTGDGEYRRDFTHVDDVAAANILAMNSEKVGQGEVINIGAGDNHSVKEVAELIGGATIFIPPRPGDPLATLADRTRAQELLNWEPQVKFTDGIAELKKIFNVPN